MALESNIRNQLQAYLAKMEHSIEIRAQLDGSDASAQVRELLEEVVGLSPKISFQLVENTYERTPTFSLNRQGEETGVLFAGTPMGHEFTSFVLALLQVSGYPPKIEQAQIQQIQGLSGKLKFETFISLSCHNCPDVVQALNILAVLNPGISHTMIDGAMFQEEVNEKKILSVPTVFLNGESFGQGRMELDEILSKVDRESVARQAEAISHKEPFDVLVVGGGPSGTSAAIYAARKGIRTGIVAERIGGQLMETLSIENFISVKSTDGPKLAAGLMDHMKEYNIDIMNLQQVRTLSREGDLLTLALESGATLKSKTVVLATGARWRELGVSGEREFKGKGVAYCPHCEGPLFKGKRVAVIGGGNSGVEAGIDLAGIVEHVTLLEFAPELKADAVLQKRLRSLPNVEIIVNAQTTSVLGTDKVTGMTYVDRGTQEEHRLDVAGVFVQIGLVPNTDWLKETVECNRFGEIVVDDHGATSMPGVFASGDCTTVPFKQIIIAMGEGAKTAISAFDYIIRN